MPEYKRLPHHAALLALAIGMCAPMSSAQGQEPLQPAAQPAVSMETARRESWTCLTNAVEHGDSFHRAQAISALGTIGAQPEVVQLVEKGLIDDSTTVRQVTVKTLGDMESRGSVLKLRAALFDDSALVVYTAALALWNMGDDSAEDIFIEVLMGERKTTRHPLNVGWHYAKEKLHDPAELAQLGAERAASIFLGPAGFAVNLVGELAKDGGAPARANSARMLARSQSENSRAFLEEALEEDTSARVRAAAAEALAQRGDANAIPILAPLLKDDRHEVQYAAAAAILRLSSPR